MKTVLIILALIPMLWANLGCQEREEDVPGSELSQEEAITWVRGFVLSGVTTSWDDSLMWLIDPRLAEAGTTGNLRFWDYKRDATPDTLRRLELATKGRDMRARALAYQILAEYLDARMADMCSDDRKALSESELKSVGNMVWMGALDCVPFCRYHVIKAIGALDDRHRGQIPGLLSILVFLENQAAHRYVRSSAAGMVSHMDPDGSSVEELKRINSPMLDPHRFDGVSHEEPEEENSGIFFGQDE